MQRSGCRHSRGNQEVAVRREIFDLNQELDKAFEMKNELAAVIQQIDALRLELAYFERFQQETKGPDSNVQGSDLSAESISAEVDECLAGL